MRIIDPDTFRSAASHRAAVKRAEEIAALQYRIEQLEAQLAKAREDALEEAARICDDSGNDIGGMWLASSKNCAIRIRAAKEKK